MYQPFFGYQTYRNTSSYEWYLLKESLYAELLLNMSFGSEEKVTQDFKYQDGRVGQVRSQDLVRNLYMQRSIDRLEITLKQNLVFGVLFGLLSAFLTIFFFIFRGYTQSIKKVNRGQKLVSVKDLRKLLLKGKAASDLSLDKLPLVKDKETSHMMVTGTTGSGKSNCFNTLLPQIRERGDRAIIVDLTGDYVLRFYNSECDTILNPFDQRSTNWSVWDECQTEAQFDTFAEAFVTHKKSVQDSFWDNAGRIILSTALKKLKEEGDCSVQNLYEVLVKSSLKDYSQFFLGTEAAPFTDEKGDKTTFSIRSTLVSQIACLKHLEEKSDFSIRQWIEDESESGWLFLTARPDQRKTLKPLITAWMDIAINALMTLDPDSQRRLWFIVDELPALQKLPSLEAALAESRKYGGCLMAGIQSFPQLINIYGHSTSQALLDLFNTKIFFRSTDPNTTSWISNVLGEAETKEVQENLSYGSNTMRDGVSLSQNNLSRPIVLPTEIMSLKDLECYVKLPGQYPVSKLAMNYKPSVKNSKAFVTKEEKPKKAKISQKIISQGKHSLNHEMG